MHFIFSKYASFIYMATEEFRKKKPTCGIFSDTNDWTLTVIEINQLSTNENQF